MIATRPNAQSIVPRRFNCFADNFLIAVCAFIYLNETILIKFHCYCSKTQKLNSAFENLFAVSVFTLQFITDLTTRIHFPGQSSIRICHAPAPTLTDPNSVPHIHLQLNISQRLYQAIGTRRNINNRILV